MNCREYLEIVSAHIDGALSTGEELSVRSHLDQCNRCRRVMEWESKAVMLLRQNLSPLIARGEVKQKLLDKIRETDGNDFQKWFRMPLAWMPVLSLVLVVAAIFATWSWKSREDIFADVAAQYRQMSEGLMELSQVVTPPTTARLQDLTPWGYQLVGQRSHQTQGQERRVFVHQGQQKDLLVAQELHGAALIHPSNSSVLRASGREFVSISTGDLQMVAWQDKNIVCILAANVPRDRLLTLAQQIANRRPA